jgi:hypothetical protein
MNLLEGDIEDIDREGVTVERRSRKIALRLRETDKSYFYETIITNVKAGFGISLNEFVTQSRDYIKQREEHCVIQVLNNKIRFMKSIFVALRECF